MRQVSRSDKNPRRSSCSFGWRQSPSASATLRSNKTVGTKDEASGEKRRVPTQERSRARVARMLDAATEVFAEVGFDAATTEAIAERAGTSIGSVYQFFPNKKALFDAIGERYLDEVRVLFERFLSEGPARAKTDWRAMVDDVIDAFWAFDRDSLAFRAVWLNMHRSAEFLVQGDALNREMAERLAPVLGIAAPKIKPAKRLLVATMVVETLSALLLLALRRDERMAKKLVDETKVLVRRYLEPYAD